MIKIMYLTGIYALNLSDSTGTPGDWHYSAIDWNNIKIADLNQSSFGNWRLYRREVPYNGEMLVADHIRACLDLIEKGAFSVVGGMKEYFICDKKYNNLIFEKVWILRSKPNWNKIDDFMGKEYLCDWLKFKRRKSYE